MAEYIGYISAIFTSLAFAPQAMKTIRTKSTESISLGTYVIFTVGVMGWLIYGILQNDPPIILANAVTLIFAATILILKLKNG